MNGYTEKLAIYLEGKTRVSMDAILALGLNIDTKSYTGTAAKDVKKILKRLGWKKARIWENGERSYRYVKIEEPEAGPMSGPMSSPGPMSGPMSDEPKNPTNSTLSLCPYVSLCDSENESGIGESVIPPDKQGGTDRDGRDIPELMSNPNGLARPYVRPYVSPTKGTLPPHRDTLKGPGLDEADLDPDSY